MKNGCAMNALLAVLDTALCLFVFFPLSVTHWRGTWDLLDVYVIPDDLFYSSWVTLCIGGTTCVLCTLVQPHLSRCAADCGWVCSSVFTRGYMYLFSWAVLCYWRGVWNLMDLYMTDAVPNSVVFYVLGVCLAALFRSLRTIAGIPVQVQIDVDPELLKQPDTRFKVKPSDMGMFVVDICFSQFVLVSLAIFVWRGIWNVLDYTLFPDDRFLSDVTSLAGGYATLIVIFTLEYPASLVSSHLDKYPIAFKILFEDLIMVAATWGVLMLWRGAWNLMHTYFLPDRKLGGWVSHALGVGGLLVLQGFGNVATNGIDVDGSYTGGAGIFQTHYLRFIFGKNKKFAPQKDMGVTRISEKQHLLLDSFPKEEDTAYLLSEYEEEEKEEIEEKEEDESATDRLEFEVDSTPANKIELRQLV